MTRKIFQFKKRYALFIVAIIVVVLFITYVRIPPGKDAIYIRVKTVELFSGEKVERIDTLTSMFQGAVYPVGYNRTNQNGELHVFGSEIESSYIKIGNIYYSPDAAFINGVVSKEDLANLGY